MSPSHLKSLYPVSQASGNFVPTVEIRANREFQASQGRSYLLDLPLISGGEGEEDDKDDDNSDQDNRRRREDNLGRRDRDRDRSETDDREIVNVGQEHMRRAYDFMRLRRRRIAPKRGKLGKFVSSLRLGGSVTIESEKSVRIPFN